jgi:hypothetical protein
VRKLMIPVVVTVVGLAAAAAWSQTPGSPFQATPYFTTPLEHDASRIVKLQTVTIPPGASNEFHRHNGDQWAAVQEGEVTFTIKGQPLPSRASRRAPSRSATASTFPAAPFTATRT